MMRSRVRTACLLACAALLTGCAGTKAKSGARRDPNVITHEEIIAANATNLHDVVQRLRPQWLKIPPTTSIGMNNEIVVFQDQMQLGGPDALRQVSPELAYELRWLDGVKASSALPGLMSGRHIEGVIIISTKPGGGD